MAHFVEKWRPLLAGYVGAEQRKQCLAWVKTRGLFQRKDQIGGPQPVRKEVLDIFRSVGPTAEADEVAAVQRHCALQMVIHKRLRSDKLLLASKSYGKRGSDDGCAASGASTKKSEKKSRLE